MALGASCSSARCSEAERHGQHAALRAELPRVRRVLHVGEAGAPAAPAALRMPRIVASAVTSSDLRSLCASSLAAGGVGFFLRGAPGRPPAPPCARRRRPPCARCRRPGPRRPRSHASRRRAARPRASRARRAAAGPTSGRGRGARASAAGRGCRGGGRRGECTLRTAASRRVWCRALGGGTDREVSVCVRARGEPRKGWPWARTFPPIFSRPPSVPLPTGPRLPTSTSPRPTLVPSPRADQSCTGSSTPGAAEPSPPRCRRTPAPGAACASG